MATEIELPDGTILEAPEGADPSTVAKAYLAKQRSGSAAPSMSPAQVGASAAQLGSGLLKGRMQLATQPEGAWKSAPLADAAPGRNEPFVGPTRAQAQGPQSLPRAMLDNLIGAADIGQSMLRGVVNPPALTIAGLLGAIDPNDTYQAAKERGRAEIESGGTIIKSERLRTPQGATAASTLGNAMRYTGIPQATEAIGGGIEKFGGPTAGPILRDVAGNVASLAMLGAPRWLLGAKAPGAAAAESTVGAAAASPMTAALATASPELKAAATRVTSKRGPAALNPQVLDRHLEAESLPVPIRLTEGQATGDPVLISTERNARAANTAFSKQFEEQNAKLHENITALRDESGPDVFTTHPVDHGDTLIKAYKDKAAAADAEVDALYQQLRDAAGGNWPVDAGVLLKSASERLHKKLLFEHAPKAVMSQLERLATTNRGKMTFEQYEALRTNLARIQRSADGNEVAAAGVIRSAMEDLPITAYSNTAATLKPLADAARAAARKQFQALDADPAYKAAVNDAVPPDRFVQRFIVGAPRDVVAKMRANLAGNDAATQTMGVAAIDFLKQQAGSGVFSQARYNKALAALSPKLKDLVSAPVAENLQRLGTVARDIQHQPAGSFVNNSNTFVAQAGEAAKTAGEIAANAAAKGIPVGTFARGYLGRRAARKQFQRSTQPGAGLGYVRPKLMD